MKILATGNDALVIDWAYQNFGVLCTKVDLAVAIMDAGQIVGAAFYQAHNGPDIEMSYYGPGSMTLPVVRGLAKIAVNHFGVSRITVRAAKSNKTMTRGIHKIGFVYEGIRHHAYGDQDAVMYGLFGKNLMKLAGKAMQ